MGSYLAGMATCVDSLNMHSLSRRQNSDSFHSQLHRGKQDTPSWPNIWTQEDWHSTAANSHHQKGIMESVLPGCRCLVSCSANETSIKQCIPADWAEASSKHLASSPGSLHGFTGNTGGAGRWGRKKAWYKLFAHAWIISGMSGIGY